MSFLKRIAASFSPAPMVSDDVDPNDPGDEILHQRVEEAVAGVDDSEELDYAEDMESLANDRMVAEGSPVFAGYGDDDDKGDWTP